MFGPNSPYLTMLLGALAALGPMSMDIYLVSMPSMTTALSATVNEVQLTISIYMVGFGMAQLLYGPLSDRFGRRPALIGGLFLHIVASIAAALANSITLLIVARLFQAIGMCGGIVVTRAVVRDLHTREQAARTFSYMQMVTGLAPLAAPIIGSYLHVAFGWRANFIFVGGCGVLALMAVLTLLGETNRHPDREALSPRRFLRNVRVLLSSRNFIGYLLTMGFLGGGLFAFLSGSSFVFLHVFGFEESYFGYLFAFVMVGNLVGAHISGRLVMRVGIPRLLASGLVLAVLSGLVMAALAFAAVPHVLAVLGPMFMFMVAFQMVWPQAMAGALSPFPHIAGYASSVLGVLQFGLPALVGIGVAATFDGTSRPMAGMIAIMAILAALAYRALVDAHPAQTAGTN
jgi:DHA1 family bicyclomycin/chloramphenicol resistance-like MFS transporter